MSTLAKLVMVGVGTDGNRGQPMAGGAQVAMRQQHRGTGGADGERGDGRLDRFAGQRLVAD